MKTIAHFVGGTLGGNEKVLEGRPPNYRIPVVAPPLSRFVGEYREGDTLPAPELLPIHEEEYVSEPWTQELVAPALYRMTYRWRDPSEGLRKTNASLRVQIEQLEGRLDRAERLRDVIYLLAELDSSELRLVRTLINAEGDRE